MVQHGSRLARHPRALTWLGLVGAVGVVALMGRAGIDASDFGVSSTQAGVVLIALASAAGLASVVALPDSLLARGLSTRWLVWVGRRSYGLYLYHYALITLISPWSSNGHIPWRNGLIALLLSFVIAAASYRWLEQPAIRWMREREKRIRARPSQERAAPVRPIALQA